MRNHIYKILLDILFPPHCSICEKYIDTSNEFELLCDSCFGNIETKTGFSCSVCGKRIPTIADICHKKNFLLISASDYNDNRIQKLIHDFKYRGLQSLAKPLGRLMLTSIASVVTELPIVLSETYIVPIPLSTKRAWERGFNQSERLAQEIIKFIPELELRANILKKVKTTTPQAKTTSREERKLSAKDIFEAKKNKKDNILLIDDVFTTGATIEDAVRALKKVGYKRIIAFTAAKT